PAVEIGGIERVVDPGQGIAGALITARIEEKRTGGVAGPREARRRVDHAGDLQAGVEDVLVRRAFRPEPAAAHRRTGERDAHLAEVVEAAREAVRLEQQTGPRE